MYAVRYLLDKRKLTSESHVPVIIEVSFAIAHVTVVVVLSFALREHSFGQDQIVKIFYRGVVFVNLIRWC